MRLKTYIFKLINKVIICKLEIKLDTALEYYQRLCPRKESVENMLLQT